MTNTELMKLKVALDAKQMELAAQLRGRVKELMIEGFLSQKCNQRSAGSGSRAQQ